MSHYLTQNSNIRAPLCWEADILQMAITYQLGLGKLVYSFVPYFPPFGCLDFWMFPESLNACAEQCINQIKPIFMSLPMGTYFSLYMICKVCMFDLNFCSHYIVEYILLAYFCLGNKNENEQFVYCNNWSSGTLYMCVVSMCMVGCAA